MSLTPAGLTGRLSVVPAIDPPTPARPDRDHRVAIFVFDGVQSLDVTGPAEVFAGANLWLEHAGSMARYHVSIVSLHGGPVRTESAVTLMSDPLDEFTDIDTLIVPGGSSVQHHQDDAALIGRLSALVSQSGRLVTVCSGAFLAAATGALDGHRVTTHWARSAQLRTRYAEVTVDDDPIFIHSTGDGRGASHPDVWSSAGVTAGIDLSLAIVEHDHCADLAQTVARWLVMFLRRPGGQSQFATPTWVTEAPAGPIRAAQQLVVDDPADDHRVALLATRVDMSERHFIRRFAAEVGMSPSRYVARVRTDAARHALETTDDTLEVIARRCGFGTAETLRRTLLRQIGVTPDAYRRRFAHRPDDDLSTNPQKAGHR